MSTSDRISFTTPSIVFSITFPLKIQQSLIFLDFFSCLVFSANAARRHIRSSLTYTVGPSPLSRKRRLAWMTMSRTWVKFDDHWPWSCLRVCTWHAPSEPMTCHYVGTHSGRCDSHCFVHNRQQLAGGVFPFL